MVKEKVIVVDKTGTPHRVAVGARPGFRVFARNLRDKYWVMGCANGDLFNPQDINDNIDKKDKERGGRFWRLMSCSQPCYEQYTVFLRSKNRTPYLIAQRRFRNDFR